MAKRSLRLGFAGTPAFAVAALDAVARSEHTVVAVFTKPDRPAGRGRREHISPVKQRALELGLAVLQPSTFRSPAILESLGSLDLDALVVVAYGLILPPPALAAPRLGCFNIHASLLPRWRGAAPIQRALLAGDSLTGVTIMRMDAELDTGPTLAVRATQIEPGETGGTLHDRLAVLGAELMRDTLEALAAGPVPETAQPAAGVTYAEKISKAEAEIDWREDAVQVLRKVRAFNPSPVAQTHWAEKQLRIWEAELSPPGTGSLPPGAVIEAAEGGIDVACGRGALRIRRLQLEGRKPLDAAEFLRSQRLVGASFEGP